MVFPLGGGNLKNAHFIFNGLTRGGAEEGTIPSEMYEVTFAHDNVYYCFCYHKTVDLYDSVGHSMPSLARTYQVVG